MIDSKILQANAKELTVLYVEDDKELSMVTKELLGIYFKNIDTAYNGEEGVVAYKDYFNEKNKNYDLVITDIGMPKMDGMTMAKKILKINDEQSIVIITAFDSAENLKEAIMLGIDGFLEKPIQKKQLLGTLFKVTQIINNRALIEEHIEKIELLNIQLEKSFRMLDTTLAKNEKTSNTPVQKKSIEVVESDIQGQVDQLIHEDLPELREVLIEIDAHLIFIIKDLENIAQEDLDILIKNFSRYSAILHFYTFFNDLSLAMADFTDTMQNVPLPIKQESKNNVFTLLETFIYVLSKWQDDLVNADDNKLNQFDSSLINDMQSIVALWIDKEDDTPMEDLDDIFDF